MGEAVAVAGLVIGLAATVWRMFAHYDQKNADRFKGIDAKNDARFRDIDAKNDARFRDIDAKNDARFRDIDVKSERRINELRAENREAHAGITKRIDDLYSLLVKRP